MTALTGDITKESKGTDIIPTKGNPPLDMPMSKAAQLAITKY
jgi:hypothetical protein